MSTESREYVVGLPVVVNVENSGFVTVEVDLSELAESIWDATNHEGSGFPTPDEDTIARDEKVLQQWTRVHSVKNEGYTDDLVIVMAVEEDGEERLLLVCPFCEAEDTIEEVDTAMRWNRLEEHEDGLGLVAYLGENGDYENDGFICTACTRRVGLVDAHETEIVEFI